MTTLKDNKRSVSNLRKQFLSVKGKLWIKALYVDTDGRTIQKLSDASAEIMSSKINQRRATFNAITKGIKLCQVQNGFSSSAKVLKIIDWGVKYGNDQVTIKRFSRNGKYYTGVWVKGRKGIVHLTKSSFNKKDKIENYVNENSLSYDSDVWNIKK